MSGRGDLPIGDRSRLAGPQSRQADRTTGAIQQTQPEPHTATRGRLSKTWPWTMAETDGSGKSKTRRECVDPGSSDRSSPLRAAVFRALAAACHLRQHDSLLWNKNRRSRPIPLQPGLPALWRRWWATADGSQGLDQLEARHSAALALDYGEAFMVYDFTVAGLRQGSDVHLLQQQALALARTGSTRETRPSSKSVPTRPTRRGDTRVAGEHL